MSQDHAVQNILENTLKDPKCIQNNLRMFCVIWVIIETIIYVLYVFFSVNIIMNNFTISIFLKHFYSEKSYYTS